MGRRVYPISEVQWPTSPGKPGRIIYSTGNGDDHRIRFYLDSDQPTSVNDNDAAMCQIPKGGKKKPAAIARFEGEDFLVVFK